MPAWHVVPYMLQLVWGLSALPTDQADAKLDKPLLHVHARRPSWQVNCTETLSHSMSSHLQA